MYTLKISKESRELMNLVSQAIFTNPFSEERTQLNIRIAGEDFGEGTIYAAAEKVNTLVQKMEVQAQDPAALDSHSDRELIRRTILFNFFHIFLKEFDEQIVKQCRTDTNLRVSFSENAIYYLLNRGFSETESVHYFELSFQLRRAFYFINTRLIGESRQMIKFREQLWNNVFTDDLGLYNNYLVNRMEDFSTLILGETGTGKGTAAKAIGCSGYIPFDRKTQCFKENFNKIFRSINLSQFSESLIESELFGHRKGAFTGANEDYKGVFGKCSPYGSIFLDEIGELSENIQIKLLKILQEREYSPVGSREIFNFKGRVIAATNKTEEDLLQKGQFRKDFFYRLCSDIIYVPTLYERIQNNRLELKELLKFTVRKIIGKPSEELTEIIENIIQKTPGTDYHWPGNVRELEQCVRRILLKKEYTGEKPHLIESFTARMLSGLLSADELLSEYCTLLYRKHGNYSAVAEITELDWRTVKKHINKP